MGFFAFSCKSGLKTLGSGSWPLTFKKMPENSDSGKVGAFCEIMEALELGREE